MIPALFHLIRFSGLRLLIALLLGLLFILGAQSQPVISVTSSCDEAWPVRIPAKKEATPAAAVPVRLYA